MWTPEAPRGGWDVTTSGPASGVWEYLDRLVTRYETDQFILLDPISIPLGFDDPADQELIGLYAALLSWGRRKTILSKLEELCQRMDHRPTRFVTQFDPSRDADALAGFGHRTFLEADAVNLTLALQALLKSFGGLEAVFLQGMSPRTDNVGAAIQHFSEAVMAAVPDTPRRLRKHLARPLAGSACKRLCMYLRWMVRPGPVDLGIWKRMRPEWLVLPLDVHSGGRARALGLVTRKANDWTAALELTARCRQHHPSDPARYDYALFGPGAMGEPLDPRFVIDASA